MRTLNYGERELLADKLKAIAGNILLVAKTLEKTDFTETVDNPEIYPERWLRRFKENFDRLYNLVENQTA